MNFLLLHLCVFFSGLSTATTCQVKYGGTVQNLHSEDTNDVIYYLRPYLQCDDNNFYRIIMIGDPLSGESSHSIPNELCRRLGGHYDSTPGSQYSWGTRTFSYFSSDERSVYNWKSGPPLYFPDISYSYSYVKIENLFKKITKNINGKYYNIYKWNNNLQPIQYSQYSGKVYILQMFSCVMDYA